MRCRISAPSVRPGNEGRKAEREISMRSTGCPRSDEEGGEDAVGIAGDDGSGMESILLVQAAGGLPGSEIIVCTIRAGTTTAVAAASRIVRTTTTHRRCKARSGGSAFPRQSTCTLDRIRRVPTTGRWCPGRPIARFLGCVSDEKRGCRCRRGTGRGGRAAASCAWTRWPGCC